MFSYFDSTGGATALLSDCAAAVYETMQKPWRSFSSLSTSCFIMHYTKIPFALMSAMSADPVMGEHYVLLIILFI